MLGIRSLFYKRRDYEELSVVCNPIVAHEFLAIPLEGLTSSVDDMISPRESMFDLARTLKMHKARRIFCVATFGLFTRRLSYLSRHMQRHV